MNNISINSSYILGETNGEYNLLNINTKERIQIGLQEYLFLNDIKNGTNFCNWDEKKKNDALFFFESKKILCSESGSIKKLSFHLERDGLLKIKLLQFNCSKFFDSIFSFKPHISKPFIYFYILFVISVLLFWIYFTFSHFSLNNLGSVYSQSNLLFILLSVSALFFLSTCIHEFGHAFISYLYLKDPGIFGVMLFFLQPVAYCDLTCTFFLKKRKKALVFLSGTIFQISFMVICMLFQMIYFYYSDHYLISITFFELIDLFSILFNLIPTTKLDGYYILSALTDKTNLYNESIFSLFQNKRGKKTFFGFLILITELVIWLDFVICIFYFIKIINKSIALLSACILFFIITIDQFSRYKKIINNYTKNE